MKKNLCGVLLVVMASILVGSIGSGAPSEEPSILPWGVVQEALRWQVLGPGADVPCEALLFILAEPVEDHHIERLINAGYAVSGVSGKFVTVLAPITLYIDQERGADTLDFVHSTLPELGNWHNMEWSGWSDEQLAACIATSSESPEDVEEEKTWDDSWQFFQESFVAYNQTSFCDAISLSEEALVIVRALGGSYAEGVSLNNLGICYKSLFIYHQAINHHEQALAIKDETKECAREAACLNDSDNCYYVLSDYQRVLIVNENFDDVWFWAPYQLIGRWR